MSWTLICKSHMIHLGKLRLREMKKSDLRKQLRAVLDLRDPLTSSSVLCHENVVLNCCHVTFFPTY